MADDSDGGAQTVTRMWHGQMVGLTLTPAFVRQTICDMETLTHLRRLDEDFGAALSSLSEVAGHRHDDDWADSNIPANQLRGASKAFEKVRLAIRARCQQLAEGIEMRKHVLGNR